MRFGLSLAALAATVLLAGASEAQSNVGWDITGGQVWEDRVGVGVLAGLGGVDCTDDYCERYWDTKFIGSIEGVAGIYWRIIPNVVVLIDFSLGYVNADIDRPHIDDDRGATFQVVAAGEFHAPISGWLDAYVGLGIGFAYLGFWAEEEPGAHEFHHALKGLDFEFRTGADLYLFSSAPTLGMGPYFKLDFPVWLAACVETEGAPDDCDHPDDIADNDYYDGYHFDELPFLVHFGIQLKYGF